MPRPAPGAYRGRVDPFVKLTRVPRRPPWIDVLVAGALLAWALTEALVASGPGPLAGRVAFAVVVTVPLVDVLRIEPAERRNEVLAFIYACVQRDASGKHPSKLN